MLVLLIILTLFTPIKVNAAEVIVDENSYHTVEESEQQSPDLSDDLQYNNRNIAEYRIVNKEATSIQSRMFRSVRSVYLGSVRNGFAYMEEVDGVLHYYISDTYCTQGTDRYDDGVQHFPIGLKVLQEHYIQNDYDDEWLDLLYYKYENGKCVVSLMPSYNTASSYYQSLPRVEIEKDYVVDLYLSATNGGFTMYKDGEPYPYFAGSTVQYAQIGDGCYLQSGGFENCDSLERVYAPYVSKFVSKYFKNCVKLSDLECEPLEECGSEAFYNCPLIGTTFANPMPDLTQLSTVGSKAFWLPEDTVIEGEDAPLYNSGVKTYFTNGTRLSANVFNYDWNGDNRAIYWHIAEPDIKYIDYKKDTVLEPTNMWVSRMTVACNGAFWNKTGTAPFYYTLSNNTWHTYYADRYDCEFSTSQNDDGSWILHLEGKIPNEQHNCVFQKDLLIALSECPHENTHVKTTAWCTTPGVESVICDDCNNVLSRKDVPALGHEFPDDWTVTREPTNTTCGDKEKVCIHGDRCDQRACDDRPYTLREPIPLLGSTAVFKPSERVETDTSNDEEILNQMVDDQYGWRLCDLNPSYKQIGLTEWELTVNGEVLDNRSLSSIYVFKSLNGKIIVEIVHNRGYAFYIETDYDWSDEIILNRIYSLPNYNRSSRDAHTAIFFVNTQCAYVNSSNEKRVFNLNPGCRNVLIMTDCDLMPEQFYNRTIQRVYIPNYEKSHTVPNYCFNSNPFLTHVYANNHDFREYGKRAFYCDMKIQYIPTEHVKYVGHSGMFQLGYDSKYSKIYLPEIEILSASSLMQNRATEIVLSDSLMYLPNQCIYTDYELNAITPDLNGLICIEQDAMGCNYHLHKFSAPNIETLNEGAFSISYELGTLEDQPVVFGPKLNNMEFHAMYRPQPEHKRTYIGGILSDTLINYDWNESARDIEWCDDVTSVLVNDPFFFDTGEAEDTVKHVDVSCTGSRVVDHKQVRGIPIETVIDDGSYTITAETEDNVDYNLAVTGDLHNHAYDATGLTTKVADWKANTLQVYPNPITGPEDDAVADYMDSAVVMYHIEALDGTNEDKDVEIPVQGLTGSSTPIQYGEHVQEFEYNGARATATVVGTCLHKDTEDATTTPKCLAKGKVETTCKQCGEVLETKDTNALGHNLPTEWTTVKEPTTEEFGLKVKVCTRGDDCDERMADGAPYTLSEVIPKLDKPAEEKLVKILINPDDIVCDEGEKLIDHITKIILVYEITNPDGTKTERREEISPSDIPGLEDELATYGRDTLDITIGDVTGSAKVTVNCLHKQKSITSTDATCTHGGVTNMVCKQCGYDFNVDEAIAPLGHDMPDEWTTVKIPTDTEKGLKKKVCKRGDACDERMDDGAPYTIFEEIPKLKDTKHTVHYYSEWEVVKEATCTADGVQEKKCDDPTCNNTMQETIPKMGHDMADGVHIVQDDKGYTLHKCIRNDYEYRVPDITVKVKLKSDDSSKTKGKKVTLAGKEETTNDSGEATFTLVPEGSQELEVTDAGTVKFNVTKDGAKNIKRSAKNGSTISTSFKEETLTVNVNLDKKKEDKKDDDKKEESSQTQQSSQTSQQTQEQPVANFNDMLNWIQNATGLPSVLPQTGQDNVQGNDKQVVIAGLPVNKSTLLFGIVIIGGVVIFLIKRKK